MANFIPYTFTKKDVIDRFKNDKFDIEKAKEIVIAYVKNLLVLTDGEKEFLSKLHEKSYTLELLFDSEDIVENIKQHPAALWRVKENNN